VHHRNLLRCGPCIYSTASAVETSARPMLLLHGIVVNIVHDGCVHVGHGLVVYDAVVIPIRTMVAAARVSESIVNAAVKTYVRTPIAGVPTVDSGLKAPPRRCPQRTHPWSKHPRTRYPVVSGAGIIPVSGGPNIIVSGTRRLRVIGYRRRGLLSFYRLLIRGVGISILITSSLTLIVRIAGTGLIARTVL
jgi:hypothetical protein